MTPAPYSRWDQVRAGLIGVVLLLQLLDAMPLPELKRHHLANPVAQRELRQWSKVLTDAGVEVTHNELAELGLQIGGLAGTFRRLVLRPWHPFRKFTGTGQSWGLFAYPEPATGRLVVDGRSPEGTETFYRAPGGRGDHLEAVLEYRRIRGVYDDASDRPKPRRIYKRFGRWVSARVMAAHPEVLKVEVRLDRHLIRTPDEGVPPPDQRRHVRRFARTELEREGVLEPLP